MSDLAALGPWLRRFLCEYIVTERNLARNTRKSYRDTFSLLLPFVSRKLRKPVDRLAVWDLTSEHVLQFLAHLETDRGCTAGTRNQRLAAIRAFARYVGSRDPIHVEWCGHIRAIASKKSMPPPVGWLTRAEMKAMLATPDRRRPERVRPSALPLQHRRKGLRSHSAEGARSADRVAERRARSRHLARQGRQDAPVPAMAGNRARSGRRDQRSRGRRRRVRQPARDAVHPLRSLSPHRTLRGTSPGTGQSDGNSARDPPHHGLPPDPCRRGR